jgi:hypothetical protein
MEPCGGSFYGDKGNLSDNNKDVYIKTEPCESFYGGERNLSDNNQTIHVKMEPYEPFYGDERNLSDNIKVEQAEKPLSYNNLEELLQYDEAIRAKMEPCRGSFYGCERNLSNNNREPHIGMGPCESFYGDERNLNNNNRGPHIWMGPCEPFYGEERNLSENNQTVHVKMEPYESFYEDERNLSDKQAENPLSFNSLEEFLNYDETIRSKMEQCGGSFYGCERNLSNNRRYPHIGMGSCGPFYGDERNLSDSNQTVHVKTEPYELFNGVQNDCYQPIRQYDSRDGLEELLRYDGIIKAEIEPYGTLYNDDQTVIYKIEPCELFNDEESQTTSTEVESSEFFDSEEENLSDESYESLSCKILYELFNDEESQTTSTEMESSEFFDSEEENLSDESYESPNGNDEYYITFRENFTDGTTANIINDGSAKCVRFVDEQVVEYNLSNNLSNYNIDNAYSVFEGNNNIANKIVEDSEINYFWNHGPFFDIYSAASRQSSKRKFEDDTYQEQYGRDLLSTTKQNASTTSPGGNSQKRRRLAYRMNERNKCKCGRLFRNSASLNRHTKYCSF